MNTDERTRLKEVALLFTKLGFIAFGGPAAHIAMMQDEVVVKRKWMSEQHFLDLIGATNLIPGPNSTEMAIHIGREYAGWKGLVVAGLCFIVPAVFITGIFAFLYREYGTLPPVQPFIYGIQPAIIAVILFAILPLAKKSLKTKELMCLGLLAFVLSFLRVSELVVLFGTGLLALLIVVVKNARSRPEIKSYVPLTLLTTFIKSVFSGVQLKFFLTFLKIGAILYGSGYVLFAFLDTEFVLTGRLSRQQLTDAIAVGQFTPGPVFSSVTFIGYQLNGLTGAALATTGIFLPSFVFVAFLNPLVKKMRKAVLLSVFLDAVNVASVAVIVAVCCHMAAESISDWRTALIAAGSFVLLLTVKKMNSALVVIGGALCGYLLHFV